MRAQDRRPAIASSDSGDQKPDRTRDKDFNHVETPPSSILLFFRFPGTERPGIPTAARQSGTTFRGASSSTSGYRYFWMASLAVMMSKSCQILRQTNIANQRGKPGDIRSVLYVSIGSAPFGASLAFRGFCSTVTECDVMRSAWFDWSNHQHEAETSARAG